MRNFINFNMDPSKHQSALTLENFSALFNMLNHFFLYFSFTIYDSIGSDQDFIKIAGVTVPFIVKGSKVYFDLLAAFSLMGQLQLAMKNDWKEIDTLLQEQGFDLRVAFRINISERSYMTWKSQRSAITYDALKALVHSEIVPEGQRKDRLIAILEHLDTDMMGITRAREDLVNKIQAKVDENVMVSDPIGKGGVKMQFHEIFGIIKCGFFGGYRSNICFQTVMVANPKRICT